MKKTTNNGEWEWIIVHVTGWDSNCSYFSSCTLIARANLLISWHMLYRHRAGNCIFSLYSLVKIIKSSFISADTAILRLPCPTLGLYQLSSPLAYPVPQWLWSTFHFTNPRTKEGSATDPDCHARWESAMQTTIWAPWVADLILPEISAVNGDALWSHWQEHADESSGIPLELLTKLCYLL